MRRHFRAARELPPPAPLPWLARLGFDPTRHGWNGWLQTEQAIPKTAFFDRALIKIVMGSVLAASREMGKRWQRVLWFLASQADPNDWRLVEGDAIGVRYLPLSTRNHRRIGAQEPGP